LYVGDTRAIILFTEDGSYIQTIGIGAGGLCVIGDYLYASDYGQKSIHVYGPEE